MQWPNQPTAIVLYHGIGQQSPFETLDPFVRSFWTLLDANRTGEIIAQHKLRSREGWVENYVSLSPKSAEASSIDFYEYYWANLMDGQISFQEVVEWLRVTSAGATRFYESNSEFSKAYEGQNVGPFKDGRFTPNWYVGMVGRPISHVLFLLELGLPPLTGLLSGIAKRASQGVVDYLGDVAIYTTTDVKSRHYAVRRSILDGAVAQLRNLLLHYDRIILAGHSLGSVIAFDALNRLNLEMNAGQHDRGDAMKIKGLATFGSPLDKIAFFFRERADPDQYVRRQVLEHYHGFHSRDFPVLEGERTLANPINHYLEHVTWLNFWDEEDPVSGRLDFYADVTNMQFTMGEKAPLRAHGAYFGEESMYQTILEQLVN